MAPTLRSPVIPEGVSWLASSVCWAMAMFYVLVLLLLYRGIEGVYWVIDRRRVRRAARRWRGCRSEHGWLWPSPASSERCASWAR
jgi:hypothetical protein